MTAKRINITIEEETLKDMDATAEYYGMNRSQLIAFAFEALSDLGALEKLSEYALQMHEEKYGTAELYYRPSAYAMQKAARECTVTRA